MLNQDQFRTLIVRQSLSDAGYWAQNIENFILGVGLVESGLAYLAQIGGPAYGPYQVEEAPYADTVRYIIAEPDRHRRVLTASGYPLLADADYMPCREHVIFNLRYATLICRMFFARFHDPIPEEKDYEGMAALHKRLYNTSLGKTDMDKSIIVFKEACSC